MKKISFFFLVAFMAITFKSVAQDTTRTLFKLIKPQTLGLYVTPEYSYGQLRGSMTSFGGASAMLVVNKKWAIGATAQMSLNDNFSPKAVSPLVVKSSLAGGKIEYTPNPDGLVHISFPLMVGVGEASIDSIGTESGLEHDGKNDNGMLGDNNRQNGNAYVVVQPGIHLEANLMRYAKFYIGANYRLSFLSDNKTAFLPANTMQGLSLNAGLKLGLFDFNLHRKKEMSN